MNVNGNFKTLGLTADASWDDVKSAFRRLARTYHPDVAGPDGARKFAEITEAYMTLKETISPGAVRSGCVHYRPRSGPAEAVVVEEAARKEPLLGRLWRKLASLAFLFRRRTAEEAAESEKKGETFEDIPPVRVRFIGSILSRAETEIDSILSTRSEVVERNRTEAILRRLRSRHPGVVLLALKRMTARDATDEIRRALTDHFKKSVPTSEVLESVLALFSSSPLAADFARVLAKHAAGFSQGDALMVLRWYKRLESGRVDKTCYAAYLGHSSKLVVAAALSDWPAGEGLPETMEMMNLLKTEDETVLIPFLRLLKLLKKEKLPIWILQYVDKIVKEHQSAAVRVWASAIVRDRNLG